MSRVVGKAWVAQEPHGGGGEQNFKLCHKSSVRARGALNRGGALINFSQIVAMIVFIIHHLHVNNNLSCLSKIAAPVQIHAVTYKLKQTTNLILHDKSYTSFVVLLLVHKIGRVEGGLYSTRGRYNPCFKTKTQMYTHKCTL